MFYALLPYMILQALAATLIVTSAIWYMESRRVRPLDVDQWEPAKVYEPTSYEVNFLYTAAWVTDSGERIPVMYELEL